MSGLYEAIRCTEKYGLFHTVSTWLYDHIPTTLRPEVDRYKNITIVGPQRGNYYHNGDKAEGFIVHVNNGCFEEYPQDNPRDRVIAALDDGLRILDKLYPKYEDISDKLAVLPVDEVPDIVTEVVENV